MDVYGGYFRGHVVDEDALADGRSLSLAHRETPLLGPGTGVEYN